MDTISLVYQIPQNGHNSFYHKSTLHLLSHDTNKNQLNIDGFNCRPRGPISSSAFIIYWDGSVTFDDFCRLLLFCYTNTNQCTDLYNVTLLLFSSTTLCMTLWIIQGQSNALICNITMLMLPQSIDQSSKITIKLWHAVWT